MSQSCQPLYIVQKSWEASESQSKRTEDQISLASPPTRQKRGMSSTRLGNRLGLFIFALSSLKVSLAFPNSSPVINSGWGTPDRLMHLYTATEWNSFHLQINHDGRIDGSPHQTIYSKFDQGKMCDVETIAIIFLGDNISNFKKTSNVICRLSIMTTLDNAV